VSFSRLVLFKTCFYLVHLAPFLPPFTFSPFAPPIVLIPVSSSVGLVFFFCHNSLPALSYNRPGFLAVLSHSSLPGGVHAMLGFLALTIFELYRLTFFHRQLAPILLKPHPFSP